MENLTGLLYVVAAVLFILGLKSMAHPRTAVRGNLLGASGMLVAVIGAFIEMYSDGPAEVRIVVVMIGLLIGSAIGLFFAIRVQMTEMPQLVALFNGFGGGASVFVAGAQLVKSPLASVDVALAVGLSGLIGAVTFLGSVVAFGKLQEIDFFKQPLEIPYHHVVNGALAFLILVFLISLTTYAGVDTRWPAIGAGRTG